MSRTAGVGCQKLKATRQARELKKLRGGLFSAHLGRTVTKEIQGSLSWMEHPQPWFLFQGLRFPPSKEAEEEPQEANTKEDPKTV